jgi:radical SAM superfamily enzyme YgiQ (UPF0313 family)
MKILLLTPPMTQLNTPYPATAYLTAFLKKQGYEVVQSDPAILLALRLFSRDGVGRMAAQLADDKKAAKNPVIARFLAQRERYEDTVDTVIRYLQGGDQAVAWRLCQDGFLPDGRRTADVLGQFAAEEGDDPLAWAFGSLGIQDRARFFASLYIDELADVVRFGIDPDFTLSRYGEKLAASAPTFDPIAKRLAAPPTLVQELLSDITRDLAATHRPDVIGFSVPFPGNVFSAFFMAKMFRSLLPEVRTALGGGYVNTELRSLQEPRVFDYFDYVTLDDGERPLLNVLEHSAGKRGDDGLLRTFVRRDGVVRFVAGNDHDVPIASQPAPDYTGLPLRSYLLLTEMLNPMHRIWSDSRWNKLTLAHGCYWKKCSFCDVTLDYIVRYEDQAADLIIDKMLVMMEQTGQSGFHFVDEAAPPKVLAAMAKRLIERRVSVTWWGNIRFEKTFTPALVEKLAASGCVAVSGGLEVASDRLLQLINKGVTVEQVARVAHAFTASGVLVHAYLMFGFPSQTMQETVDSLERVRQLFEAGCIQSAFWHRFSATIHSPIGKDPAKFGIKLHPPKQTLFAANDVDFTDPTGVDHDMLGRGLNKALYNYMHGVGLDEDVRFWFEEQVPKARVNRNLIAAAISN